MLVISTLFVFIVFLLALFFIILLERTLLASVQNRVGPNISGFWGLLQASIDGLKTFLKFIVHLKFTYRLVFILLPILLLFLNFIRLILLPLSTDAEMFDFLFDLLVFYTLSGVDVLIYIVVAWVSFKSKFPRIAAVRELLQLCAFEIILGICFLVISLHSGCLNSRICVDTQTNVWFLFVLFPYSILFFISILGELHRTPFDATEAEAELTAGYQTEFGGLLFSLFYLAEYLGVILSSILFSTLFLGGCCESTFIGGSLFMATKALAVILLIIFIRSAVPRIRIQTLLTLAWGYLVPLSAALLPVYIFVSNTIKSIRISITNVWSRDFLSNFLQIIFHQNSAISTRRVVELDVRADTSLVNFIHSQNVNPETAKYIVQTKRLFNNNAGIGFIRNQYDQNLSTLLHIAGLNTVGGQTRFLRSPVFCHNVHSWKVGALHELFKGLFDETAYIADETITPSLPAQYTIYDIVRGWASGTNEAMAEALSSIKAGSLEVEPVEKATNVYTAYFGSPFLFTGGFGLNDFGSLNIAAVHPFIPELSGLPDVVNNHPAPTAAILVTRGDINSWSFGNSQVSNPLNNMYGHPSVPQWYLNEDRYLATGTFENDVILNTKPVSSSILYQTEHLLDLSIFDSNTDLAVPKNLKNFNTKEYLAAVRHSMFVDETTINSNRPVEYDMTIKPSTCKNTNPAVKNASRQGFTLGSYGHIVWDKK